MNASRYGWYGGWNGRYSSSSCSSSEEDPMVHLARDGDDWGATDALTSHSMIDGTPGVKCDAIVETA